jgi:hypothetical protein
MESVNELCHGEGDSALFFQGYRHGLFLRSSITRNASSAAWIAAFAVF